MILLAARIASVLIALISLAAEAESRTVNLAAPAASLSQIAFYVAQERGFFRDEGLDVNLIVMGAPVANLALIGQNVDFSSVPTAALSAMLRGAPLRVIFNAFYRPLVWLYSKAEIRSVKELKGKRVGVAGIGSGPDHLLRELLRQNGMDPGRDVTILGLGVQSNLYTALSMGNIDASVFVIPWNFTAADAGFFELVSFVHQDTVQFQGSIVVRDEFMRTDPQPIFDYGIAVVLLAERGGANEAEATWLHSSRHLLHRCQQIGDLGLRHTAARSAFTERRGELPCDRT